MRSLTQEVLAGQRQDDPANCLEIGWITRLAHSPSDRLLVLDDKQRDSFGKSGDVHQQGAESLRLRLLFYDLFDRALDRGCLSGAWRFFKGRSPSQLLSARCLKMSKDRRRERGSAQRFARRAFSQTSQGFTEFRL